MKTLTGFLLLLLLSSCGAVVQQFKSRDTVDCRLSNGCVVFGWDPSPVDLTNGGYTIFWGPSSGVYTHSKDVGKVTTAQIDGLTSGVHYFTITAYIVVDKTRIDSEYADELVATAHAPSSAIDHGFPIVPDLPSRPELIIRVP